MFPTNETCDIVDYIRGGDAKKGEGSSSRPLSTPINQGVSSSGLGRGLSVEDAAEVAAVDHQSGPRSDSIFLQSACTRKLMDFSRTETPRQADRNKSDQRTRRRGGGTWAAARSREGAREEGRPSGLWRLGIQLAVGPQPLRLRNHNFGLAQRIMVKRLATSRHDPLDSIGYPRMRASGESSTTKHRLLHASGSHPIPPPNDPK
ncbi:hypothetical protein F511_23181 [Dorcoceras hygrometricum]|uniref:Uncharacterized protein n=1 Tax=Dorcoceras hygrometricum TaxID=472368 RepID=A0A2Z7BLL1_9LAMI|nr:hypothetical protein F511_23181 [Dorcoceras hygrometricum]